MEVMAGKEGIALNLRNCPKCGKLFVYISKDLCPECIQQEEVLFDKVRDYIKKTPGCNLQEVSENTGASVDKILLYLREGRLIGMNSQLGVELQCLSCGKPISGGRLCEKCAKDLGKELTEVHRPGGSRSKELDRHKMHTKGS